MHVRTRTWLSFFVALSLLFMAGSRFGVFEPLENTALTGAAPVQSVLRDATRPLADFVNNLTDVGRFTQENRALQEENERLLTELGRLRGVEAENERLENLVGIREVRPDDLFVAADVFGRDPGNLTDVIAIDRGRSDGVQEGMVVLTQQGSLIGSVSRSLDDVAWVTLVTDPTSAVSAFIQDSRAEGVVVGAADGSLTMEFVQEQADVKEGDLVFTSGIGGRHPREEMIGQVVEVDRSPQELFQAVRVEPLADLSRLESVLVLASFIPQEDGGP